MIRKHIPSVLLAFTFFSVMTGCSTTPPEVVELSYKVGEDVNAIGDAYRSLVKQHFKVLKQQRIDYLENEWKPKFIENWLDDGRLVDMATSKTRWDFENSHFAAPTPGKERQQLLASVLEWSTVAIAEIERKKDELIGPLSEDERLLLSDIDSAFQRIGRAHNAITAHLNSIREVEKIQDKFLEELSIKDFRDDLMKKIETVSNKAEEGLEKIRELDNRKN
jgi:hypothetical protein